MKLSRLWALLCLGHLFIFPVGCVSMVKTMPLTHIDDTSTKGLIYYLPKKLLKLTVTRKAVPTDAIKKAAKDAEDAKTAAESAQKASKEATDTLTAMKKIKEDNATSTDEALKAAINEELSKRTIAAAEKGTAAKNATEKAKNSLEQYENALMVQAGTAPVIQAVNRARSKRLEVHDTELAISQLTSSITQLKALIAQLEALHNQSEADRQTLAKYKKTLQSEEKAINIQNALLPKLKQELTNEDGKARKEFERAIVLATQSGASMFEDDVNIQELAAIPDTSRIYVASLTHWITREDHLNLTTTPSGLLKTAAGESLDKSPQILEDVAKLAIMLATGLPTTGNALPKTMNIMGDEQPPPSKEPAQCADIPLSRFEARQGATNPKMFPGIETKPFTIEFTFDPADFDEVLGMNAQLCMLGTNFLVNVRRDLPSKTKERKGESAIDGLVYRRPIPYIVDLLERMDTSTARVRDSPKDAAEDGLNQWRKEILDKQKEVASLKKSAPFTLPNGGPIATIPFEAGFFVQSKFDVGFDDGMLTKSEATKPSELHALVQLPLAIAKDIISVPAELIQLKVNYASKDTDLLAAQKANIEARQKLDKAIEEFRAGRENPSGATQ